MLLPRARHDDLTERSSPERRVLRRIHLGECEHRARAPEHLPGAALRCELDRQPHARVHTRVIQSGEDAAVLVRRVPRPVWFGAMLPCALCPLIFESLTPVLLRPWRIEWDVMLFAQPRGNAV